jgi:CPA2 family monovalent cation:H+ antiporter-2
LSLLLAVAALITVKALILFMLGRVFGLNALHNSGFSLALAQGGEFAFVLFQFADTLHILPQTQEKFLTLVVATSIAVTPLLMVLYNRLIVPKFLSILPERSFDRIEDAYPIILAGFGRFGQVIGRFLNAQGVKTTVLEKDPDQIELLRKFGFKGYFGDASRLDLLRSAGAAKAKLLIVAVDDPEISLEIVRLAKAEFPRLKIFARARNRRHAYELSKAGVNYYKREVFDSSLEMAQQILVSLGKNESDIHSKAIKFKQHDEATLKASFDFFDDEPELVNFMRTQRAELERILQNDLSGDSDS